MADKKVATILWKREAPFTQEQIAAMPDAQAWAWIRADDKKLRELKSLAKLDQVCFTGFTDSDKKRLSQIAEQVGFEVKTPVTQNLVILITGEKPGASKLEKAKAQNCKIMNEAEFVNYVRSKQKQQ